MEIKEKDSKNPNQVRRTIVGNKVVSTIFLSVEVISLDRSITSIGDFLGISSDEIGRADLRTPGNYETMVFDCDPDGEVTSWEERDFARYETEDEAKEGHQKMVDKWAK